MMDYPFVSIILPIRNEAAYIVGCLNAVFEQDYPSERMEILIADGMSNDNTLAIIRKISDDSRIPVTIIDNPQKIVPTGMNLAIRQAKGDIIIRVDGHCNIASDYVRKCVEHIQKDGVDGVGGAMKSVGETTMAKVIAMGMSSPFGVGNSAFRTVTGKSMLVDSVPFPAYTRRIMQRTGLYDEELVRNQDDEYNYRLRNKGGKILLAEDVHSTYFSRTSWGGLWKQYFQYGFWKVRVLQKLPEQMSPRQFMPPALVLALLFSGLLALAAVLLPASFVSQLPTLVLRLPSSLYSAMVPVSLHPASALLLLSLFVPGLYIFANLSAAGFTASRKGFKYFPLLPFVFAALHLGYGLGFLAGLFRFWNRWGDKVGKVQEFAPAGAGQPQVAAAFAYAQADSAAMASAPVTSFERTLLASAAHELEPAFLLQQSYTFKRLFDVLASFLGLFFLWPLFLLAAVLIKRDSPGPAFFRASRTGKNGKEFQILKFRTMKDIAEAEEGPSITAQDDPRITPLGRWLRMTKLNEFPQLWNVLKGEMSLVGPRPEDPQIVSMWPAKVRRLVLSMRPGMTSPASVVYRNEEELLTGESLMDQYLNTILPDKLRLDQLYVRNNNLATDLDVIFWTLIGLLPRIKHASIPENTLFWGPLSSLFNRYFTWFMADFCVAFIAVAIAGAVWRLEYMINLGYLVGYRRGHCHCHYFQRHQLFARPGTGGLETGPTGIYVRPGFFERSHHYHTICHRLVLASFGPAAAGDDPDHGTAGLSRLCHPALPGAADHRAGHALGDDPQQGQHPGRAGAYRGGGRMRPTGGVVVAKKQSLAGPFRGRHGGR